MQQLSIHLLTVILIGLLVPFTIYTILAMSSSIADFLLDIKHILKLKYIQKKLKNKEYVITNQEHNFVIEIFREKKPKISIVVNKKYSMYITIDGESFRTVGDVSLISFKRNIAKKIILFIQKNILPSIIKKYDKKQPKELFTFLKQK